MDTKSVEQLNKNEAGLNLNRSYSWFQKTFTKLLTETVKEFWNCDIEFKLIGVCEDENFFMYGSEYFATRIKLSKEDQFVVRLSKETVRELLDMSLGVVNDFEFEKITELEGKIVTAFNNVIYDRCKNILLGDDNITNLRGDCHLTFLMKQKEASSDMAKLIITIPKAYLKCEEVFPSDDRFKIGDFPTAMVDVGLYIGATTLPLSDVKNLEKEDIIVLENSNINNMTLYFRENEIGFKVSPDPSLIINYDEENGGENMSNAANIWDNIQVDISAEFEKVKISLGEIKQISEGLVVDMGSIYDNKVYLKVEDKTIASGGLVIINDRYGVRIDEVIEAQPVQEVQQPDPEPDVVPNTPVEENIPVQENMEQGQPGGENGEFDYKDFDVDDENI